MRNEVWREWVVKSGSNEQENSRKVHTLFPLCQWNQEPDVGLSGKPRRPDHLTPVLPEPTISALGLPPALGWPWVSAWSPGGEHNQGVSLAWWQRVQLRTIRTGDIRKVKEARDTLWEAVPADYEEPKSSQVKLQWTKGNKKKNLKGLQATMTGCGGFQVNHANDTWMGWIMAVTEGENQTTEGRIVGLERGDDSTVLFQFMTQIHAMVTGWAWTIQEELTLPGFLKGGRELYCLTFFWRKKRV